MHTTLPSRLSLGLVIALAFTIPMQVAVNNLVLILLLLVSLPMSLREIRSLLRSNPVARAALGLFFLLLLGTLWGKTEWLNAMGILGKYMDLALIPLFMVLLRNQSVRDKALLAFFSTMTIVLILSWSLWLGLIPLYQYPIVRVLVGHSALLDDPSIFHSHITQGMLTAFASFLFALKARQVASNFRFLLLALSVIAGMNVLFLLKGGTGYLVLMTLIAWLGWIGLNDSLRKHGKSINWRYILGGMLVLLITLTTVWRTVPLFHDRINTSFSDAITWRPGLAHGESSVAHRLDFYVNTLQLIENRPLSGYGTGGFGAAFSEHTAGADVVQTNNPHNEYLMLAAQVGLGGPLLLVLLFVTQWRYAAKLPEFERYAGRGLVLAYALSCMLNSMLLDHTEGLFFAFMTALFFVRLNPDTTEFERRQHP